MKLMTLVLKVPAMSPWFAGLAVFAFGAMVAGVLYGFGVSAPLAMGIASVGALCALFQLAASANKGLKGVAMLMAIGALIWAVVDGLNLLEQ